MVLPATTHRVPQQTDEQINRHIEQEMHYRLSYFAQHAEQIDRRLKELDAEWNIERTLEANASALALTGLCMGTTLARRWYLLSAGVMAFLLQHAVQGWCPPVPLLRRLGFRTPAEIERERAALKALRGDFGQIEAPREDNVSRRVTQAIEAISQPSEHPSGREKIAPSG